MRERTGHPRAPNFSPRRSFFVPSFARPAGQQLAALRMDCTVVDTLTYADGAVRLIDQTLLPNEIVWCECRTAADLADAIRAMRIRGAPAIGVAAAYALALGAREYRGDDAVGFRA